MFLFINLLYKFINKFYYGTNVQNMQTQKRYFISTYNVQTETVIVSIFS